MILRATQPVGDLFAPATVDLFAGAGGASHGIEWAWSEAGYPDRYVDLAVNHWDAAVSCHAVNHPYTEHRRASVFDIWPTDVLPGRELLHLHASPDCTHHSRARGGKPVKKNIRGLAWVVCRWARLRRPTVITLENVAEFLTWGPLTAEDKPDPARKGQTFNSWKTCLERLGYVVEHRVLAACDYGAPTTRRRLFIVARRDGRPIVWPEVTHGKTKTTDEYLLDRSPHRTKNGRKAASNRDRSPGPRAASVSNTERGPRASRDRAEESQCGNRQAGKGRGAGLQHDSITLIPFRTAAEIINWSEPMCSIFATPAEAKAWAKQHGRGIPNRPLADASLSRIYAGFQRFVVDEEPMMVPERFAAAYLVHIGNGEREGQKPRCMSLRKPLGTLVASGCKQYLVVAYLTTYYGTTRDGNSLNAPCPTLVGKDRIALVTAVVDGTRSVAVDFAMRMLLPREGARAQGFPDSYIIDRGSDGRTLPKSTQTKLIGNSVPPVFLRALTRDNVVPLADPPRERARTNHCMEAT